jgi:hypothetical protein
VHRQRSRHDRADTEVEQVWHVLDATNRWVAHGEGKAALALASAGAIAGALFAVVQAAHHVSVLSGCAIALCGAFDLAAAVCAALCLWARLGADAEPTSLIFFHHLARKYGDRADEYVEALLESVRDGEKLSVDIARQIWANAQVAKRKFRWANLSVAALIGTLVSFAAACVSLAVR